MIYLVDDNDDLRAALEELVGVMGYEVYAFSAAEPVLTGLAAVDSRAVDLLITDIRLPGIDGLELVARLRRVWPGLPVIVISSLPSEFVPGQIFRDDRTVFLSKPIRMAQLAGALESLTSTRCAATNQSHDH